MRSDSIAQSDGGATAAAPPRAITSGSLAVDLALVLLLAVMSTLAFHRNGDLITPDSRSYIVPTENLLAGRGFSGNGYATTFTERIPGYPNVPGPETLRTPAYPLLIALFLVTGVGLHGVIAVQHLLNIAIALALYSFVRSTTRSRSIALLAAAFYALLPTPVELASTIQPETLFTTVALAAVIAAYYAMRRDSLAFTIASGLLLGIAVLVKPVASYFFLPLIVVFAIATRRRVLLPIVLLITSQLLPLGWAMRNLHATGVATVSTAATENLLFEWAASVHATRNEGHLFRMTASQQQLGFRSALHRVRLPLFYQAMAIARAEGTDPARLSPARKSIYERRLALHILRKHPIEFAEIFASGVVELLVFEPPSMAFSIPIVPRSAEMPLVFVTLLGLLIACAGIGVLYRQDRTLALLIGATIGYFTLVSAIPEAIMRYAVVYVPLYAVAIAEGLVHFASRYAGGIRFARSRARRAATSGPS